MRNFFRAVGLSTMALAASVMAGEAIRKRAIEKGEIGEQFTKKSTVPMTQMPIFPITKAARGWLPQSRPHCSKRGGPSKARRGLNYWRR